MNNTNAIKDAFRSAMIEQLGISPDEIKADGKAHRFSTNGKKDDNAGRYILHIDSGIPAGYFECHRQGIKHNWKAGRELTPNLSEEERQAIREQSEREKANRDREHEKRYQATATRAANIWRSSGADVPSDYPYLMKKGIQPHGARFQADSLLIPLYDETGKLWNIQRIFSDGKKRFLSWGKKRGMFAVLGEKLRGADTAFMVEGWATACTVVDLEPGTPVIVAFDAGNLEPVTGAVLRRFGGLKITIVADNDRNPASKGYMVGIKKAQATAGKNPGVSVVVPEFPEGAPLQLSDINDLMNYQKQHGGA